MNSLLPLLLLITFCWSSWAGGKQESDAYDAVKQVGKIVNATGAIAEVTVFPAENNSVGAIHTDRPDRDLPAPKAFSAPISQPETPEGLLKRIKSRLEHDKEITVFENKLKEVDIPAIAFSDTPIEVALDHINKLIRSHNKAENSFHIPLLQWDHLDLIPDSEVSAGPTEFYHFGRARITLSLAPGPLVKALEYLSELTNLEFDLEPNRIQLTAPPVHTKGALTRQYMVPKTVFANEDQLEEAFVDRKVAAAMPEWEFDEQRHLVTVKALHFHDFNVFELWYSKELLKHGYSLSSSSR